MGKQPTYQELLAAYNKLLMENKLLHKEVDRLQSLLNGKGTPLTLPIIKRHLSLEEKVDVFRNLFKGREDVFARRWYRPDKWEIRLPARMQERMGQTIM